MFNVFIYIEHVLFYLIAMCRSPKEILRLCNFSIEAHVKWVYMLFYQKAVCRSPKVGMILMVSQW